jgi:hypothetical protein
MGKNDLKMISIMKKRSILSLVTVAFAFTAFGSSENNPLLTLFPTEPAEVQ